MTIQVSSTQFFKNLREIEMKRLFVIKSRSKLLSFVLIYTATIFLLTRHYSSEPRPIETSNKCDKERLSIDELKM